MYNIKEIGACIYLCEGTKQGVNTTGSPVRRVELCNSNPQIIEYFLHYLRTFDIDEKKLKARIFIHEDINEKDAKEWWSEITKIPLSQFLKTSWRKSSKWCKHRLPRGTIAVRYGDAKIFREIMKDIAFYFPIF